MATLNEREVLTAHQKEILNTYDRDMLATLYTSLEYMECQGLPAADVKRAIEAIEIKYR